MLTGTAATDGVYFTRPASTLAETPDKPPGVTVVPPGSSAIRTLWNDVLKSFTASATGFLNMRLSSAF